MRRLSSIFLFVLALVLACTNAAMPGGKCKRPDETSRTYRSDGEGMPALYEQLTSCPNITSLDLELTATGCVINDEPWSFQFRKGDKFPALRHLRLSDYDVSNDREWRWANFQHRSTLHYQVQKAIGQYIPALKPGELAKPGTASLLLHLS